LPGSGGCVIFNIVSKAYQTEPPVFEQGPIRPPSEAYSLLVRVTRNCPWNRCAFCPVYKGSKFSKRPVEEVKSDILAMKWWADEVKGAAWRAGYGSGITEDFLYRLYQGSGGNPYLRSIILWFLGGASTVFLQDADSLVIPAKDLAEIVRFLRETLPSIDRVTTYSRSKTLSRHNVDDLKMVREAGLDRVHVGLESGSDRVLELVNKGVTAEGHILGGRNALEAGFELSEYVMPGLGGRALSEDHALETARVLNAINPHFIRIRTLAVSPGTPLFEKVRARGDEESDGFEILNDLEMARELRLLIESLDGIQSFIVSDHMLNLFQEIEGRLPGDKPKMLAVIDRFFEMSEDDQLAYIIGRRAGIFYELDQMQDPALKERAHSMLERTGIKSAGQLHEVIQKLVTQFI
jgi:radical SAM superfamily enzyme YgiQ (UPF0313 family)